MATSFLSKNSDETVSNRMARHDPQHMCCTLRVIRTPIFSVSQRLALSGKFLILELLIEVYALCVNRFGVRAVRQVKDVDQVSRLNLPMRMSIIYYKFIVILANKYYIYVVGCDDKHYIYVV